MRLKAKCPPYGITKDISHKEENNMPRQDEYQMPSLLDVNDGETLSVADAMDLAKKGKFVQDTFDFPNESADHLCDGNAYLEQ
jgi:hypothetical protein